MPSSIVTVLPSPPVTASLVVGFADADGDAALLEVPDPFVLPLDVPPETVSLLL